MFGCNCPTYVCVQCQSFLTWENNINLIFIYSLLVDFFIFLSECSVFLSFSLSIDFCLTSFIIIWGLRAVSLNLTLKTLTDNRQRKFCNYSQCTYCLIWYYNYWIGQYLLLWFKLYMAHGLSEIGLLLGHILMFSAVFSQAAKISPSSECTFQDDQLNDREHVILCYLSP